MFYEHWWDSTNVTECKYKMRCMKNNPKYICNGKKYPKYEKKIIFYNIE